MTIWKTKLPRARIKASPYSLARTSSHLKRTWLLKIARCLRQLHSRSVKTHADVSVDGGRVHARYIAHPWASAWSFAREVWTRGILIGSYWLVSRQCTLWLSDEVKDLFCSNKLWLNIYAAIEAYEWRIRLWTDKANIHLHLWSALSFFFSSLSNWNNPFFFIGG